MIAPFVIAEVDWLLVAQFLSLRTDLSALISDRLSFWTKLFEPLEIVAIALETEVALSGMVSVVILSAIIYPELPVEREINQNPDERQ